MADKQTWMGWRLIGWTIKATIIALVIAVPVLGVWISSTLATYLGGPVWLAIAAGVAFFPVLPLLWEAWSRWRRRHRPASSRVLTTVDRMIMRTCVLNALFVGAVFGAFPTKVYEALGARGDWMLDGLEAEWAKDLRRGAFAAAERFEWLHERMHRNRYEDLVEREGSEIEGAELIGGDFEAADTGENALVDARPDDVGATPTDETPAQLDGIQTYDDRWPFAPRLHPRVADLPAQVETSYRAVALHLAGRIDDPLQLTKAIHDYVADRVAYDVPSYRAGQIPAQDAETTFRTRSSVCAGYANLVAAMGEIAGLEIVVVIGDARGAEGTLSGEGHAWNAVQLDGRWYLMDATWNAGHVDGERFIKRYDTTYFMSPPEVFGVTHLPQDPRWQLRDRPLSRGEFLRQPHLRGDFFALSLGLQTPDRSQSTVADRLTIELDNPRRHRLTGQIAHDDGAILGRCRLAESHTQLDCSFESPGRYQIQMFGPSAQHLGNLYVVARG